MNRPYVILNAGITLDGKIATRTGNSEISSKEDLKRVHHLRESVDAIMVGINTVIEDDPRLSIHKINSKEENPVRVVVDSMCRIPLSARMFNEKGSTIVAVSIRAKNKRINAIKKKAEVIVCGSKKVDLKCLNKKLFKRGINKLLLEGGGTLNWGMISEGLVDEVSVAISPRLVGGKNSITLIEGEGYEKIQDGPKLKLKKSYPLGEDLILEYTVIRAGE